jgi:hypothetical protein
MKKKIALNWSEWTKALFERDGISVKKKCGSQRGFWSKEQLLETGNGNICKKLKNKNYIEDGREFVCINETSVVAVVTLRSVGTTAMSVVFRQQTVHQTGS